MRTGFAIIVALAFTSVHAAPLPKELRVTDNTRILGHWVSVEEYIQGRKRPERIGSGKTLLESGQSKIFQPDGIQVHNDVSWTIDPETKPRTFDWTNGENKYLGAYELDGDTLRVVLNSARDGRPTEVHSTAGLFFTVYERRK